MNVIQSFFLGIVQGLTEFLPISSTAHLRIVPALLKWSDPGTAFSAVIQLGTLLAVVIYFWKDIVKIYGSFIKDIVINKNLKSHESQLALWILLGTIPICTFGILFKKPIEQGIARDLNLVAYFLILFGVLLYISEILGKQNKALGKINLLDVFLIGLAQSFALLPGVSRSGVTIFAGLLLGLKRHDAARFSFLLSVPAVFLSSMLEFYTLISTLKSNFHIINFSCLVIGIFSAFGSGYLAIDFLLRYLKSHTTHIFVLYRIALGVLILYLSGRGIIH